MYLIPIGIIGWEPRDFSRGRFSGSSNQKIWYCYHDNSFSFLQIRGNEAGDFAKHIPIKNKDILSKRMTFVRQECYPFTFTVEDLYSFYHKVFVTNKGDEKFWTQIIR